MAINVLTVKRFSKRIFSNLTGASVALFCASTLAANAFDATANYVVTLRGVNIAQVAVDFDNNGQNYAVDIDGVVSGLASLVAAGTANLDSKGSLNGGDLQAEQFQLATEANNELFKVQFRAQGAKVNSFQVIPELTDNVNRVPVKQSQLTNINDPVAAFLIKADSLSPAICNRQMRIFTGIERFDINMSFAENQTATSQRTGYQGPVVLCKLKYNPVSGHFSDSASTTYMKNNQRFLMWFAPLKDTGYVIPYRVLVGTAFGDLSMVLTRLSVQ
ncbi:DUF3108 domain-containing protein [Maritalea myrionectae]|uniref:DUF3108 domain-containing protein n=1 Tax=Maritalea myrionectae TaxID=454601 RepID=UPI000413CB75|nr:DUF3108 domain-containing protein [Maritalea myrionectae]